MIFCRDEFFPGFSQHPGSGSDPGSMKQKALNTDKKAMLFKNAKYSRDKNATYPPIS